MQQVNVLCAGIPYCRAGSVSLLPIQLPTLTFRKAVDDKPRAWKAGMEFWAWLWCGTVLACGHLVCEAVNKRSISLFDVLFNKRMNLVNITFLQKVQNYGQVL